MSGKKELLDAMIEAQRFIAIAEAAIKRDKNDSSGAYYYGWGNTKEIGAAKRASMDLSRALTEVRR